MKTPHLLTALICGGISSVSAFTVDFTQHLNAATTFGVDLTTSPISIASQAIVVNVPGYGDVEFQVIAGDNLASLPGQISSSPVTQDFTNNSSDPINSLLFGDGTNVFVAFRGDTPINVDFDFVGVSLGENFAMSDQSTGGQTAFAITLATGGSSVDSIAGLRSISFDTVPEPSSALLSAIAALGLLRRRR